MLNILWMVILGLIILPVAIPIFCDLLLFFYADGAVQSPCAFSMTCLGITVAWGIAATWGGASVSVGAGVGGIGQSALASNKFVEADSMLVPGVPSLTGALGMALCGGGLEL